MVVQETTDELVCKKCGITGTIEWEMDAHQQAALIGPKLKVGQVFLLKDYSPNQYAIAVISEEKGPRPSHKREYKIIGVQIQNDPQEARCLDQEIVDNYNCPGTAMAVFLKELPSEQYAKATQALKKQPYEPGVTFIDWLKSEVPGIILTRGTSRDLEVIINQN